MDVVNKIFYVYIFLDPRKPGVYNYKDLEFKYEPFYVGKGKENRWIPSRHTTSNKYLVNKIKKIGFKKVIVYFLHEDIFENDSLSYEIECIETIGRICDNGPLLNVTTGGENGSGWKHTEESRNKIKEWNKMNPRFGIKNPMYGKQTSEATKEKIRNKLKNRKFSKKTIDKMSKAQKGRIVSDETREKLRQASLGKSSGRKGKKMTEKQFKTWYKSRHKNCKNSNYPKLIGRVN